MRIALDEYRKAVDARFQLVKIAKNSDECCAYVNFKDVPRDGDVKHLEFVVVTGFSTEGREDAIADWLEKIDQFCGNNSRAIYWRVSPELDTEQDFLTKIRCWKVYSRVACE